MIRLKPNKVQGAYIRIYEKMAEFCTVMAGAACIHTW